MHLIRRATIGDCAAIGAAQARAFFDDPLQSWALPDPGTRLQLLAEMFTLLTRVVSVPHGESFVDAGCATAAFWVPPGAWGQALSDAARRSLSVLDVQLAPDTTRRFALANDAMHAAHPPGEHWYLQGLGTDPSMQRRGLGAAVLAPVLERADADAIPCYLESTKLTNLPFYERLGFAVTGTLSIGDSGPTLWTMWREPTPPGNREGVAS